MAVTSEKRSGIYGQKYISMLAGNSAYMPGAYEFISSVTLGSDTSSASLTSIPATYKSLQLRASVQSIQTGTGIITLFVDFNGDSGSNYSRHSVRSTNNALDAVSGTGFQYIGCYGSSSATSASGSNYYSAFIMDILDYAATDKLKTIRAMYGSGGSSADNAGFGFTSGMWASTSAINTIRFTTSGTNLSAGSTFSLYGIK